MLAIRRYFYSGWAWLVPYLAAYTLYASLKWPVNPGGGEPQTATPCLLHVYWALHALHLVAAVAALRSWWRSNASERLFCTATRSLMPWLCLTAIFCIPGLYLEWPSDPWEHLRRINEWHARDIVTTHSYWTKSSYFLPYSATGHTTGIAQIQWLNLYHTCACLLLSWQYYRLARVIGLSERTSFIFVLLNAMTFGNNVFSFYRYYSISSSIFAQIGAIALIRATLETSKLFPGKITTDILGRWLCTALFLVPLIAFSHMQGLAIAGLGILAALMWRIIEWKRSMIFWLAGGALTLSIVAILWAPRDAALDEIYRQDGWLNVLYSFNLFSPTSPSFERAFQVLGAFGIFTLIPSLWLVVSRNHVVGWLTLLPMLVLALPCFALPFANILASRTGSYDSIVAFNRLLLAVPIGLALVVAFSGATLPITGSSSARGHRLLASTVLPVSLLIALTLAPDAQAYNRLWQGLQIPPTDLQLKHIAAAWTPVHSPRNTSDDIPFVTSSLGASVREALSPTTRGGFSRHIYSPLIFNEIGRQLRDILRLPPLLSPFPRLQDDLELPGYMMLTLKPRPSEPRFAMKLTMVGVAWLTFGGASPTLSGLPDGTTMVANSNGAATHAFGAPLTAIDYGKSYRLTCTLQQSGSLGAGNYLAVAWYDKDGKLLEANMASPHGAGSPDGWTNGTYSYYGLVNQPAPHVWTTYTISFGVGAAAAIPSNAAFMRFGALLNYNASPDTIIQIKDLTLEERPNPSGVFVTLPSPLVRFSPHSLSAQLSGHWPPQRTAADDGGVSELRAAVASRLAPPAIDETKPRQSSVLSRPHLQ